MDHRSGWLLKTFIVLKRKPIQFKFTPQNCHAYFAICLKLTDILHLKKWHAVNCEDPSKSSLFYKNACLFRSA